MPEICRIYGIVISMYYYQSEHNPPHIHARHENKAGIYDIKTGKQIESNLSPKDDKIVRDWILKHTKELYEMWERQDIKKI